MSTRYNSTSKIWAAAYEMSKKKYFFIHLKENMGATHE